MSNILTYTTKVITTLDNNTLRWKTIKVTCYGGQGGTGGNGKNTDGTVMSYGVAGAYGDVTQLTLSLNSTDAIKLVPANNGANGYTPAANYRGTGGAGGGASTFYINNVVKVAASGGNGGNGGATAYISGTQNGYSGGAGGFGDPTGVGGTTTTTGASGGKRSAGTLLSTTSTSGKVVVEVLEYYPTIKYLIFQYNNYYSIKSEYYNNGSNTFMPLTLSGGVTPNLTDINTYGFDSIQAITQSLTINSDIINPIDKLYDKFEVKQYVIPYV